MQHAKNNIYFLHTRNFWDCIFSMFKKSMINLQAKTKNEFGKNWEIEPRLEKSSFSYALWSYGCDISIHLWTNSCQGFSAD